jgi:hypothetical protein
MGGMGSGRRHGAPTCESAHTSISRICIAAVSSAATVPRSRGRAANSRVARAR